MVCKKNGCAAGIAIPGVCSQSMREYLSALTHNLELKPKQEKAERTSRGVRKWEKRSDQIQLGRRGSPLK